MARSFFERLTGSVRVDSGDAETKPAPEPAKKQIKAKETGNSRRQSAIENDAEEPTREMAIPREDGMSPIFEEIGGRAEEEGELQLDVYDEGNVFVLQSVVGGAQPEDIDISFHDDTLTIRGERKQTRETKEKNYYVKELYWGRFARSVVLPEEVDEDKVEASLKDGLLTVRISKKHKGEKKIKVKIG